MLFCCFGKYIEVKKYYGKVFEMGKEMGDINFESIVYFFFVCDVLLEVGIGLY